MLPDLDGYEIYHMIRERAEWDSIRIIFLTAKNREADMAKGLAMGADDYVVKPFSVKELLARVEAVLRRSPERPSDVAEIPIPGGRIDVARREVLIAGIAHRRARRRP